MVLEELQLDEPTKTVTVETARDFQLLGNSLAIDCVNTELVEGAARVELLASDADLLRWARAAGLAVPGASLRRARRDALDASVRRLRAALRRLFEALIDGRAAAAADGRCILLFLDRSRTARRRWCSMEVCGNRAKVAAHHRRAAALSQLQRPGRTENR